MERNKITTLRNKQSKDIYICEPDPSDEEGEMCLIYKEGERCLAGRIHVKNIPSKYDYVELPQNQP
jgi:hypothetical protein